MTTSQSTGQRPRVSVLIVNFNSTARLRTSLTALQRSSVAEALEVIVVDNASSDFDAGVMQRQFPDVSFLPQPQNTTWTGGNNIAFAVSSGEYVLLLNPDTAVEERAIERALGHLHTDPELVALGAYLIGSDGQLQPYYRRLPSIADLPIVLFERIFESTRRGRRYLMLDEPFDDPTRVPQPPGAFLLLRRDALDARLLDPRYFNFVSDVDLCRRLGGGIAVYPDVRCCHLRAGAGVGTRDPRERMRLYHDFAWGFSVYFEGSSWAARVYVRALLTAYLLSRLSLAAARAPTTTATALRTLFRWLRGEAPAY